MEKFTEAKNTIPPPALESPVLGAGAFRRLERLKRAHGATWDSPEDPNDPYNWTPSRKNLIATIYSLGSLVTFMSAAMIAPALKDITHDLNIDALTAQIVFSVVFLGYGFGPFVVAALSEMYGRRVVWIYSQVFYVVWNALSPVGSNKVIIIVGRLMAGMGASAGLALTGPVMADMYGKADRGKSLAIASSLPYLGPALGPILGGVVTELLSWRWVFWIMSIICAVLAVASILFIRETYTPALLRQKAAMSSTSTCTLTGDSPRYILGPPAPSFMNRLATNLLRPFKLLYQRPIIQVLAFAQGLNFGVYSFLLSTYATLFQGSKYHQTRTQASLHYFSITVAAFIVSQGGTRVMDWIYDLLSRRQTAKNKSFRSQSNIDARIDSESGSERDPQKAQIRMSKSDTGSGYDSDTTIVDMEEGGKKLQYRIEVEEVEEVDDEEEEGIPEYRVPYLVPAVLLVGIGIFIYGWAAETALHWIVVDIGACILNIGGFAVVQGVLAYQLDEFGDYSASAGAASRLLSYLMGFGFPIFAPALYKALGYGWGNNIVGLAWVVLGFPVPVVLWVWGARLRGIHWGKAGRDGEV
ncbi:putative mfs multidrug transporter [Rhypophila sp. PSN 637]